MKEFVLIFRSAANPHSRPTPEQLQERRQWLGDLIAGGKADKANRVSVKQAKTIHPHGVTDGAFSESGDFVTGYIVLRTSGIEETVELAKTNPILKMGGHIEIRALLAPGETD